MPKIQEIEEIASPIINMNSMLGDRGALNINIMTSKFSDSAKLHTLHKRKSSMQHLDKGSPMLRKPKQSVVTTE